MNYPETFLRRLFSSLLPVALVASTALHAQSTNANLSGTVTDQTGAAVPNASVTVTDRNTGVVRHATTGDTGGYTVPELKADPYTITFSAPGFNVETIDNVVLAVQVDRRVDGHLAVGAQETVQVNETSDVQRESAALQNSVSERQVRELPLLVGAETAGRSPLAFVFLDSTVTTTGGPGTFTANFRVAGNQGGSTDILIDGAPTRRAQNGGYFTEVAPGPNAYKEFTVTTSQYSAEYGASTGGVVNFETKSGGSHFHGEVYDLLRNDKLNANSTLGDLTGAPKPRDHENDFGANVGGPIYIPHFYTRKDRAFFFFNYEGYRNVAGENVFVTVPTAKMRTGDFSELLTDPAALAVNGGKPVQIFDPHITGPTRPVIPGNRLDTYISPATGKSVIDPAGLKIINFYPLPTGSGIYHNYLASSTDPYTADIYTGRVDYHLSDSQTLALSYSYRNQPSTKGGFPRFTNNPAATANGVWDQVFLSHFARAQYDITFSPRVTNHLNLGWNRVFVTNHNRSVGTQFTAGDIGIPANATQNTAAPRIGFPGYGTEDSAVASDPRVAQEIGSTYFDDKQGDDTLDIADIVSWNKGRHFFRIGGDFRIEDFDVTQYIDPGGSFNFRADQTGNSTVPNSGWTLASLITGATEFSYATIHSAQPAYRYHYPAFFANDDYKVNDKLTINLGLRYELPLTRTEAHNYLRGFDPNVANPAIGIKGALVGANPANGPTSPYRSLQSNYYGSVAPRFGFAYSLNERTVVRGGWGIFYGPLQYNADISAGTLGYSVNRLTTPLADYTQSGAFLSTYPAAPVADPTSQFIQPNCNVFGTTCQDVQEFNSPYRTPLVQQFNLNVQRDLGKNFILQVAYIGHLGQRLASNFQRPNSLPFQDLRVGGPILNKPLSQVTAQDRTYASSVGVPIPTALPYPGFAGSVAQALKPFPQYGFVINQNENQGRDYYNALQVNLNHNFSHGFQGGFSYAHAKLITNAAEDVLYNSVLGGVLQYPTTQNLYALHSLSPSDVPDTLVINYLYEFPFGRNHRFLNHSGLTNEILGGWQINGVQRYSSGAPLVLEDTNNSLNHGFLDTVGVGGNLRPNLTGAPLLSGAKQTGVNYNLLNPAAFSEPAPFNPGNLSTNTGSPAYAAYFADLNKFFGSAPAVLGNVRPFNYLAEDISLLKKTTIHEDKSLELRIEGFNVFNRHSYGIGPIDLNNGANFSQATVLGGARTFQVGARLIY